MRVCALGSGLAIQVVPLIDQLANNRINQSSGQCCELESMRLIRLETTRRAWVRAAVLQSIWDALVFISSTFPLPHTPGLCHQLAQKPLYTLTNASTIIMSHLNTDSTAAAWASSGGYTTLLWNDTYVGLWALSLSFYAHPGTRTRTPL